VGDTSGAVLLGEEADEEAPGAFVRGSDEAVKPAMLPGQSTMRMPLTGRARTHMDDTLGKGFGHLTVPP
jgi:hypothetical protein